MDSISEFRQLLVLAAGFIREGDPTAAMARAKDAMRVAPDADLRDEAALALGRYEEVHRRWRAKIEAQLAAAEAEAAAIGTAAAEPSRLPRRRFSWTSLLRRGRDRAPA